MDATIWGPHYWFVLHTIAFHYPTHPTSIQKKIYHRLIHNLHEFLPNKSISNTFQKILRDNPVTPYLDTRADFIKWMHYIHNKINIRLDQPTISLSEHYEEFQKHFETKQTKFSRLYKEKSKIIFTILIFIIVAYVFIYR
jgi:hypothetical protein